MAIEIIAQDGYGNQLEKVELPTEVNPEDWEEQFYQIGCRLISSMCSIVMSMVEERLFQSRSEDMRVIGFRERTLVTRFGDVTVNRRLYMDRKGEYMDWKPNQAAP
jgi:hypothetical protein